MLTTTVHPGSDSSNSQPPPLHLGLTTEGEMMIQTQDPPREIRFDFQDLKKFMEAGNLWLSK